MKNKTLAIIGIGIGIVNLIFLAKNGFGILSIIGIETRLTVGMSMLISIVLIIMQAALIAEKGQNIAMYATGIAFAVGAYGSIYSWSYVDQALVYFDYSKSAELRLAQRDRRLKIELARKTKIDKKINHVIASLDSKQPQARKVLPSNSGQLLRCRRLGATEIKWCNSSQSRKATANCKAGFVVRTRKIGCSNVKPYKGK